VKRLQCCLGERCCGPETLLDRFFYIRQKSYCGHCLDHFKFLQLQYFAEHLDGSEADWRLDEEVYDDDPSKEDEDDEDEDDSLITRLGVRKDEFRVRIFYIQPYESGSIYFVGVGPRGSN